MAIDSRDKRASCLGVAGPYRFVLPNPDAPAEDQGDRQQMAFSYPGILAAGGVTGGPFPFFLDNDLAGGLLTMSL